MPPPTTEEFTANELQIIDNLLGQVNVRLDDATRLLSLRTKVKDKWKEQKIKEKEPKP